MARFHHRPQHDLGESISRLQIGIENGIPLFFAHAHQKVVFGDTRIVYQNRDVAKRGLDRGDRLFDLLNVSHVHDDTAARNPGLLQKHVDRRRTFQGRSRSGHLSTHAAEF
jgi:hypothetical protein